MPARRPIIYAVCLAGLLGLGIQVVYAVIVLWVCGVGSQLIPSRHPYEELRILRNKTPVIVTTTPAEYQSRSARTLDGEPVDLEDLEHWTGACALSGTGAPRTFRRAWAGRMPSYNDGRDPAIYWYFIHTGKKDGYGYFVGYDSKLKSRVGYVGAGGFRPDKPTPKESFPVDGRKMKSGGHLGDSDYYYQAREPRHHYGDSPLEPIHTWMPYLVSENRVVEIDLQRRSVRNVFESDQIVSINLSYRNFPFDPDEPQRRGFERSTYLAVRLQDRILILDPQGGQRRTYILPEETRRKGLSFYEWNDGTALAEVVRLPDRSTIDLYWIDNSEGTVRSETVALKRRPQRVAISSRTVYLAGPRGVEDPRIVSALFSLVIPVPAVWATVTTVAMPIENLRSGKADGYFGALALSLSHTWPGLLISLLLSAGAVCVCLKRQRQYAAPWTRTWAVFVFVFGIPGLLGYLFCRRWPVREECPACREEVPRDRESCFACGTEFPEPAPKGIEVFA